MKISIELSEQEIRRIIAAHISNEYSLSLSGEDIPIEVKSKQNYRGEWERADIRIKVELVRI